MKKYAKSFFIRGFIAMGFGPIVLAIVYGILGCTGQLVSLSPGEAVKGILTVSLLAFTAGGIQVVYEIERLPLFPAIGIHGLVLYADYILVYLVNGWLRSQLVPVLIFTGIFFAGYAVIWFCIYRYTKAGTVHINRKLKAE